jgi:putative protease
VLLGVDAEQPPATLAARVSPLLPRIAHDDELERLLSHARSGGTPCTGNLGLLALLGEEGLSPEADWGVNAVNPWTAEQLAEAGVSLVWASPELSGRQLAHLVAGSPIPVGTVVFGRTEMMVAEHCVLSSSGPCNRECPGCGRRRRSWVLRDQKGYEFPVTTDASGRSHIFNSVTLDLSRSIAELLDAGVAAVRLEVASLSTADAVETTAGWRRLIEEAVAGRPAPEAPLVQPATSGHFYRGVR